MREHKEVVALQLLCHDSREYGLAERYEIVRVRPLLAQIGTQSTQLLELVEDLDQCAHIVVLQFREWQIDEVERVNRPIAGLLDELELNEQHVLLKLGLLVSGRSCAVLAQLSEPPCLLLVQDAVLQVGLRESGVDLIDFADLDVLWDDSVTRQLGFSVGARPVFAALWWGLIEAALLKSHFAVSARVVCLGTDITRHGIVRGVSACAFLDSANILVDVVAILVVLRLLMDQREADIVLELGDSEVELEAVLQRLILLFALTRIVELVEQALREGADDGFLVVVDDILEELIDELHLEVGQVEASIIVAVELVSEVEHDSVTFALLGRCDELVDPPITQMLHLRMTRHQAVKLELLSARSIQIRYAFVLVRDEHTLNNNKSVTASIVDTYLLIRKRLRAVHDGHMLILVGRIGLLLRNRRLSFNIMRIDTRYKKSMAVFLDIMHAFATFLVINPI